MPQSKQQPKASNQTKQSRLIPDSNPHSEQVQPIVEGATPTLYSEKNIMLLQRTMGNTYVQRMIQRDAEAHGKGCGCAVCGGGELQRQPADFFSQPLQREENAHEKSCGCSACSGQIQLQRDGSAEHTMVLQRAITFKAFKKSTRTMGSRKKIKSIDNAVKDYERTANGAEPAEKIQKLQAIIGLCATYLDNESQKSTKRRTGVESLQQEANDLLDTLQAQLVPALDEEPQLADITPANEPEAVPAVNEPEAVVEVVPDPAVTARGYYAQIIAGNDPSNAPEVERATMLDLMVQHLTAPEFAKAAAYLMLNADNVDGATQAELIVRSIEILEAQLQDKGVARRMVDKKVEVIAVPKDKKMTDIPEFQVLQGTQTFDGRAWETVRGQGGFEMNGKIVVSVSEENIMGTDAEGAASGTDWCYDAGYSTTVHEFAHTVDMQGLADEDRQKIQTAYDAKKLEEANGTPQEWIDGYNVVDDVRFDLANAAYEEIKDFVLNEADTAGKSDVDKQHYEYYLHQTLKTGAKFELADIYQDDLVAWGIMPAGKDSIMKPAGEVVMELDGDQNPSTHGSEPAQTTQCYASSHRLEYWAQTATSWFGSNVGKDPYTQAIWAKKGEPDKANRRNGKAEVERLEPAMAEIMGRVFSPDVIADLNDR